MEFRRQGVLFIVLIGAIAMLNLGCGYEGLKYARYSSKDPELNISVDYLADWNFREHRGLNYASVLFFERSQDKKLKAIIDITVKKSASVKPEMSTAALMADKFIAQKLKFKDAKLVARQRMSLGYAQAENILLSYKAPDKLHSLDTKFITVNERLIIFKRGDNFYILRYENTKKDFDKFDKAFMHCVSTLQFK